MIGGEGAGGPVAAALILQEHQDISWLNIDHFLDSHLGFEDSAAEDKYQKMGNIEDKSESHGVKDGQAEDGSQEMDHIVNRAEDGHVGEGEIEHDEEGIITDPEMDGIEVDGCGSHSKGGHRAGVGGGAEGWYYSHAFFVSELTLQFQESRTSPMPKSFQLQCTPSLPA